MEMKILAGGGKSRAATSCSLTPRDYRFISSRWQTSPKKNNRAFVQYKQKQITPSLAVINSFFKRRASRIIITHHARRRLHMRMGCHKGDVEKVARKAWSANVPPPKHWSYVRIPFNKGKWDERNKGHRYKYVKYGNFIMVYDNDALYQGGSPAIVLITVLGPYKSVRET